ncbi:unnamed protein product [Arctogadus glacialis]
MTDVFAHSPHGVGTRMIDMDGLSPGGPLCERCVWKRVGPVAFLMSDEALPAPANPERQDLPINMMLLLF